jgi:hypothetical protein
VGQFRTAGGLVLLSGRALGPQMFLPLASINLMCPSLSPALLAKLLLRGGDQAIVMLGVLEVTLSRD